MTAPLEGLEALAELRGAGRTPAEAVHALARSGGAVGAWASQLVRSVDSGVELGLALARTQSLSVDELAAAGGPSAAGGALALHAVIDARRQRLGRRRTLLGALVLPGILGALTVLPVRGLGLLLGGGVPLVASLMDWAPFFALATLVWISGGRSLRFTETLPGGARWHRRAAHARAAALLGAGFRAGVAPAGLFEGVSRLCPGPLAAGLGATARRIREGAALAEAMPPAERVGAPLALALAVGAGVDDLGARLIALAASERAALARQVLRWVRVLAWIAVTWASWRAFAGLTELEVGGLPGGLNLPGLDGNSREMEQLMRELDL